MVMGEFLKCGEAIVNDEEPLMFGEVFPVGDDGTGNTLARHFESEIVTVEVFAFKSYEDAVVL